jgi:hypothetical protein
MFKTPAGILGILKMIIKLLIKTKKIVKYLLYRALRDFMKINETVIV